MSRLSDLGVFYSLLDRLADVADGPTVVGELDRRRHWPLRGVYFFFEPGELRSDSGSGNRVVRVGTHALTAASRSTLRQRLGQHRGSRAGGGNHRGSIFRLLIGDALLARGDVTVRPSWGVKGDARKAAEIMNVPREQLVAEEAVVEKSVSDFMGSMSVLCLPAEDAAGGDSIRGYVERNSIALLSNLGRVQLDPPSRSWLGHSSTRARVRQSGLWNQRHVDEAYDPHFLDRLQAVVSPLR